MRSSSYQKVQSSLAQANAIAAVERPRLAWLQTYHVIYHSAVNRTKVFDHKTFAFAPDARMTARDFGLRIKARKVHFGKNIRQRIRASDQVAVLLQQERGVEFSSARHDELGSRARGVERRAGIAGAQRLARAAMRTKDVVGGNPAPAEPTKDHHRLHGLAAQLVKRRAITDLA